MPYWLTNPDHGVMPVYDMGEVERNKAHGWTLLNVGESPQLEAKSDESKAADDHLSLIKATLATAIPIKRKPGRPAKAKP